MFGIKSKNSLFLLGLAVVSLAVAACGSAPASGNRTAAEPTVQSTPVAVSHGNEVGGYVDLVDALRAGGATVEPQGEVEQVFFEVTGQLIAVNGADVQVFEFADEATRDEVSSQITPEGQPNPTTMVTWIDQPNFWAKGRVVVLSTARGESAAALRSGCYVVAEKLAPGPKGAPRTHAYCNALRNELQ